MNILVIDHYIGGPTYGMEYRPYYIAREWKKLGHNVTIIGASFSHLRLQQPSVSKDFMSENIDGIEYIWLKTPTYKSSLQRIYNILVFVLKLFLYVKKIVQQIGPDVVIASSTYPLDIYPAKKIADKSGVKLCYEVHDLWPLSPMVIGGYSKWHPFIIVMQKAENYAYKHVDKVVSLLWNAEQHMKEHGLPSGKFKCIPNGYSKIDWKKSNINRDLPELHKKVFNNAKDKIIVGFAGGFAASGSLDTLINSAVLLQNNDEILFVLVGKGQEEGHLKGIVQKNSLKNVIFLPAVRKVEIPQLISNFDITFIGGIHSILHKYGTAANKLTDYMLSSKPIIQAVDEQNSMVERVGCGICVEAENSEKVAEAILKLANMTVEEREIIGKKGHDYVVENLEWGKLSKDFIDWIVN